MLRPNETAATVTLKQHKTVISPVYANYSVLSNPLNTVVTPQDRSSSDPKQQNPVRAHNAIQLFPRFLYHKIAARAIKEEQI